MFAAFALAAVVVVQGLPATAQEPDQGILRIATTDEDRDTVRMFWQGGIAAPMANQIKRAFEDRKRGAKRFVLSISSNGGSVAEGERVIEVLRKIKTTHDLETVVGRGEKCASMCVFIYLQGQRRFGALTSSWLFHEVSRKDPVTNVTTLDRSAWLRLVDKYFPDAGVTDAWIAEIKHRTIDSDYWQTGSDLIEAKSGVIHTALGNQKARIMAPTPREEVGSAQPQITGKECKQYVASVGAVLTVPCAKARE
jgi:ATP-dependent protease ClpP protease subunit